MITPKRLRLNLWFLQAQRVVFMSNPFVPFLAPFLIAKQLTPAQFLLLPWVIIVSQALLEVPTGFYADRIGYKFSLYTGIVFSLVSCGVFIVQDGFWWMAIAGILFGVGASFLSGPDRALAYESAMLLGKPEKYNHFERWGAGYVGVSEAGGSLAVGEFVRRLGAINVMWLQAIVFVLMLPFIVLLQEPRKHQQQLVKPRLLATLKSAFRRKHLGWVLVLSGTIGNMTFASVWLTPLYYIDACTAERPGEAEACQQGLGFDLWWAAYLASLLLFAVFAKVFYKIFGRHGGLGVLIAIGLACYVLLSYQTALWGMWVFFGLYFTRAMQFAVLPRYINELANDEERATVLSLSRFMLWAQYGLSAPIVFAVLYYTDSINAAIAATGALAITMAAISLHKVRRYAPRSNA
jgi:MFS family permease